MTESGFSFDRLRRFPDLEAANLFAVDATDRLLLDEASPALTNADGVVTINDHYGALTLGAIALHGATDVRAHQDSLVSEAALAANATASGVSGYRNLPLDSSLLSGARVVLIQAPKSLAELREFAEAIAINASPDVQVYVGGRVKHMTMAMNDVLKASFTEVRASLARQKSRVLVASGPRKVESSFPQTQRHGDLVVCAYGGAFAGTKLDIGTRFLLDFIDRMKDGVAVDLGCGTGVLAVELAQTRTDVIATDESASAIASCIATVQANQVADRVRVIRDDAMASLPDASVDVIACNPPFHAGTTINERLAPRLFAAAARVLRPGGELWTVFNSGLEYQKALERAVGSTRVAGRNPKFTVTVSRRRTTQDI